PRLAQEPLQLAAAVHLEHDVAAAEELAVHVELRVGGPARVALERLAEFRVLEYVDGMKARAAALERRHSLRGKAALREVRRAFHEQHHRCGAELRLDARGYVRITHRLSASFQDMHRNYAPRALAGHFSRRRRSSAARITAHCAAGSSPIQPAISSSVR